MKICTWSCLQWKHKWKVPLTPSSYQQLYPSMKNVVSALDSGPTPYAMHTNDYWRSMRCHKLTFNKFHIALRGLIVMDDNNTWECSYMAIMNTQRTQSHVTSYPIWLIFGPSVLQTASIASPIYIVYLTLISDVPYIMYYDPWQWAFVK